MNKAPDITSYIIDFIGGWLLKGQDSRDLLAYIGSFVISDKVPTSQVFSTFFLLILSQLNPVISRFLAYFLYAPHEVRTRVLGRKDYNISLFLIISSTESPPILLPSVVDIRVDSDHIPVPTLMLEFPNIIIWPMLMRNYPSRCVAEFV